MQICDGRWKRHEKNVTKKKYTKVNSFYVWYVFKYQFEHFKHQQICQIQRKMRVPSRRDKEKGKMFFLSWKFGVVREMICLEASRKFSCLNTIIFGSNFNLLVFRVLFPFFILSLKNHSKRQRRMFSYILRQHVYLIIHSGEEIFNYSWWFRHGMALEHSLIHANFLLERFWQSNKTLKKSVDGWWGNSENCF